MRTCKKCGERKADVDFPNNSNKYRKFHCRDCLSDEREKWKKAPSKIRRKKLEDVDRVVLLDMIKRGYSIQKIADHLGVELVVCVEFVRKKGIPLPEKKLPYQMECKYCRKPLKHTEICWLCAITMKNGIFKF